MTTMLNNATIRCMETATGFISQRVGTNVEVTIPYSNEAQRSDALGRLHDDLWAAGYQLVHTHRQMVGGVVQKTRLYCQVEE